MTEHSTRRALRVGDFELVRLLGRGGMAEVYEARRGGAHGFSKRFALKRILPELSGDMHLRQMFCDEARVQATLVHPNLVQVVEFGEANDELFMVLEFVDGFSLGELLGAASARGRAVDLTPALFVAREILRALAYVHAAEDEFANPLALVHRDVAPGNILVAKTGVVKLADFGITSGASAKRPLGPSEVRGKIGYVSPEQASGGSVDARSDLFSLAVVLAEMLLGRPLFEGESEREILDNLHAGKLSVLHRFGGALPEPVLRLLERALAHSPEARPANAREFLSELDHIAASGELDVSAHELASWMSELGLIAIESQIRERHLGSAFRDADTLRERSPAGAGAAERIEVAVPAVPQSLARELRAEPSGLVSESTTVSYRMRRAGGTIVGPLSLVRMLELIATAKLGNETLVSRNDGPFLPLTSMHELARLGSRAAYRFQDFVALRATERQPLSRVLLPRKLFELARLQWTGLLCVRSDHEQTRIYWARGALVYSTSSNAEELLGARLVRSGVADRATIERVLEQSWRAGQQLGQALLVEGILTPQSLLEALEQQFVQRIASICSLASGELLFVDGELAGEPSSVPLSSPLALVARAVLATYSEAEISDYLRGIEHACLVTSKAAKQLVRALNLPAQHAAILAGLRDAEEFGAALRRLTQTLGVPRGSVQSALFVALSAGCIECT